MSAPVASPQRSGHRLSEQALEQAARLMRFNWLVAADAHGDSLSPWGPLFQSGGHDDIRLLRRVSWSLLERHHLTTRYLHSTDDLAWLLLPLDVLKQVAQTLGVAMLGGWVRNGLAREQVSRQLKVLGPTQRLAAMSYAGSLAALPYSTSGAGWPLSSDRPGAVVELGVSCMAALLGDEGRGARRRFLMRFPEGFAVPIWLSDPQRLEALALIRQLTVTGPSGSSSENVSQVRP